MTSPRSSDTEPATDQPSPADEAAVGEAAVGEAAIGDPADSRPAEPLFPDLATMLGGPRGIVDASLPGVVLVLVDVFAPLAVAIGAALASSVVLAALRLSRHQTLRQTLSGVLGIALCAGLAAWTGNAKTFFLPGIYINAGYAAVVAISMLIGHPLLGYVAAAVDRRYAGWRDEPRLRRAAMIANLYWVAMFAVRSAVTAYFYYNDNVGFLPTAKLLVGLPLWVIVVAASFFTLEARVEQRYGRPAPGDAAPDAEPDAEPVAAAEVPGR